MMMMHIPIPFSKLKPLFMKREQIKAMEGQKVDLDSNARIQLEALQKQYELQVR